MNASALISVDVLHASLADPRLRIVDCRFELANPDSGEAAWRHERIPGASYAHLERDLSDMRRCAEHGRHPLPDPTALVEVIARLGISADSCVVAYDQDQGAYAARLWWLMRAMGHADVRVLNGGLKAWKSAGLATAHATPVALARGDFGLATLDRDAWLSAEQLADGLDAGSLLLVDARGAPRFRGEVEPLDRVAGHVPGAVNRPFTENLSSQGIFQEAATLRAAFEGLLVGRSPTSVVHMCGSGVTACHNLLAMEVAGLSGSRLYADSWSGWITDASRPIATGQ